MPWIDSAQNSGTKANVDSYYDLYVNFPYSGSVSGGEKAAGFVSIVSEADPGVVTGSRLMRSPYVGYDTKTILSADTPLFMDRYAGTAINTALYNTITNAMTVTQASGILNINANNSTNSAGYALLQSYRTFPELIRYGIKFNTYASFDYLPISGNITEFGLGLVSTSAAPTDGIFFRMSGNNLYGVYNNAGTEYLSSGIGSSAFGSGQTHKFSIDSHTSTVIFKIDNNIVANMTYQPRTGTSSAGINTVTGSTVGYDAITAVQEWPLFYRTYNYATVSSGQGINISATTIVQEDSNSSKPWPNIMSGFGNIASQGQTATPMGSTALYTNTMNPVANSGLNTTALLGSGIGGNFIFSGNINCNTASGANNPDYIVTDYMIPSGSNSLPAKSLYIHGINIQATNLTPSGVYLTGVTACMGLAYGHTAESLATTESASSKGPRFIPLGTINLPTGSAQGASYVTGNTIFNNYITFPLISPVVVNPSEYVAVTSRYLTASGQYAVIDYNIGIDGYWE